MGLLYNINNEEYRDVAIKSTYPFASNATMTNGIIAIPISAFLDILIYVVGDVTAPFYISAIDGLQGTDDQALLTISDFDGTEVGTAYLDKTKDMCYIKQGGVVQAGVIVYNTKSMIRLLGDLGRSKTVFTTIQTSLAAGQCFGISPNNITAIKGVDLSYTNDVDIVADGGVQFTTHVDGSGDDVLVINLYGESTVQTGALLSINDKTFPDGDVWLAAHPDSTLRTIATGNDIQIAHNQDLTYGQ